MSGPPAAEVPGADLADHKLGSSKGSIERLAIIADIHGNLPALEAVLADIKASGVTATVNLGDCVSGPLWPRETMEVLEREGLATVRGNHDRWLGEISRARLGPSDAFAFDRLTPMQIASLLALPGRLDLGSEILAVHGRPNSDVEYLLEAVVAGRLVPCAPHELNQRLGGIGRSVVLCGHSHQARVVRTLEEVLIINPGSVGCPGYVDPTPPAHVSETGSPHARYALLTATALGWRVDLLAIAYDWATAARRATQNGRDDWARALATGFLAE
jgi:predicted phosphodiesterase